MSVWLRNMCLVVLLLGVVLFVRGACAIAECEQVKRYCLENHKECLGAEHRIMEGD